MRKRVISCLSLVFGLALVLGLALPVAAYVNNDISVTIDGARVNFDGQPPALVDGRTLVPVRGVFEMLGFDVDWDGATNTAIITSADYEMLITVGNDVFTVNGAEHTLDVSAQNIGGRTMVPIRLPLESVGFYLDWDGGTNTVLISATPFEEQTAPVAQPVGDIPAYITIRGEQYSTSLTALYLVFVDMTNEDIVQLQYMVNLTWLSLADSPQITNIAPLAELTNLTTLHLFNNQIADITPLAALTNLEVLWLHGNQITDITPLAGLANLEVLWLGDNRITDITPLAGLTNLISLGLLNSQITDIIPLAWLTNLERLWIDGDEITDWSPVDHVEFVSGRDD